MVAIGLRDRGASEGERTIGDIALVAQLAEQRPCKSLVPGSSPGGGSK